MTKREVSERIYLTGIKPWGYTVISSKFDGLYDIDVPSTRVGNAIVKALREVATKRPDLFPATRLHRAGHGAR